MTRTHTPRREIRHADGRVSTVLVTQRCCNGCGREIGDVNEMELDCAVTGRPLPDVRTECPWCAPFLAEETASL